MRVVVTADDLGLSPGVTRGILEAHRRGVVRSASLMVTFASAAEAAALARAQPDLEVGLHIDLVGGSPVSDPAAVPSLCDSEGRFFGLAELTRRLVTGRVRPADLAAEVRAQASLARSWGLAVLAWDSHRHVHLLPPVALVVGRVARDEGVRWIRRARPPRLWSGPKQTALRVATFGAVVSITIAFCPPRLDGPPTAGSVSVAVLPAASRIAPPFSVSDVVAA